MLTFIILFVSLGQTPMAADSLPLLSSSRVFGERTPLREALEALRGKNMASAYGWTWSDKAVVLSQFPLSYDYHVKSDIRLSMSPWRHLACLQPNNLPMDPRLRARATQASFLMITQAPEGKECTVNVVQGKEILEEFSYVKQQERSETLPCSEVAKHLSLFGASASVSSHVGEVLKRPLPWNPAFDRAR